MIVKRTISDKVLIDRAYEVAINPKYDEYQKYFDKKRIMSGSECKWSANSKITQTSD